MMEVKDIIRNRRIELDLTMKEVANLVGVSEGTISRWESGEIANMRRDKIMALAKALRISPAIIMGWVDDPEPSYTLPPQIQRTAYDIYKAAPVIYDVYESDDRDDLVKHADYLKRRQDYLLPNAAHEENPTPEQIENADNIMNDPEEWT